jgi:hypothetical protein
VEATVITFGYCIIWFIGILTSFLVGLASHYRHAFLAAHPDKLFDDDRWRDKLANEAMSQDYRWYGHYDEEGWWEFYSLHNLAIHAALPTLIALGAGLIYWADRSYVVGQVCRSFGEFGLAPLFCN